MADDAGEKIGHIINGDIGETAGVRRKNACGQGNCADTHGGKHGQRNGQRAATEAGQVVNTGGARGGGTHRDQQPFGKYQVILAHFAEK